MNIDELIKNTDDKYMFHGSIKRLDILKPMTANDSNGTISNIDTAIFLTNDFLCAVPYAFKDTIKEKSKGLNWSFSIPADNSAIKMKMKNVRIDNSIKGYVYIFKKTTDMVNDPIGSKQWKSYKPLKPIDIIEVNYNDYSKYFKIEE